jgi:hypothetical protein
MKNNLTKYYVATFYLCSTAVLFAQPGSDDTGGTLETPDATAPIDNYIWILALGGLIFVFMKFRAIQRKKINS